MEDAASLDDAVEVADLVRVLGGNGAIRIERGGGRLSVATASSSLSSVVKDPPCWFADGVSADAGASSIAYQKIYFRNWRYQSWNDPRGSTFLPSTFINGHNYSKSDYAYALAPDYSLTRNESAFIGNNEQ